MEHYHVAMIYVAIGLLTVANYTRIAIEEDKKGDPQHLEIANQLSVNFILFAFWPVIWAIVTYMTITGKHKQQ